MGDEPFLCGLQNRTRPGGRKGAIDFLEGSTLKFVCDGHGLSPIREIDNEGETESTFFIAPKETTLEVDLSALRLPEGDHLITIVEVDRLEGHFVEERITGIESAGISKATVAYEPDAGTIALRLLVE